MPKYLYSLMNSSESSSVNVGVVKFRLCDSNMLLHFATLNTIKLLQNHSKMESILFCRLVIYVNTFDEIGFLITALLSVFSLTSKRLDTVPHKNLINRLEELNLHPLLLKWTYSYLMNHNQHVVVNGSVSESTTVFSGVPHS